MASIYPAAIIGLGHSHGRIAAGYRADLVRLNGDLEVLDTWINGVSGEDTGGSEVRTG